MYAPHLKRLFDFVASLSALVVLSPILLAVALAIFIEDRHFPFFIQERVGKDGRPYRLYKFRSMPVGTPSLPSAAGTRLTITRVGKVIRRTNMDELPQLLNILRGEMSVVGPRPAIAAQENLLRLREQSGASRLKPGLTGLAQVSSYDNMPEEEKARFDGEYARKVTALGDLAIIARTFGYLAKRPPSY